MKILLVDDDPFMLNVLVRQLQHLGYPEIVPYQSAQDALSMVESCKEYIRVIFVDLQMPFLDGIEVVRHLAQLNYSGGVVLVSGEDDRVLQAAERLAKAHKLTVLGALHKPVFPQHLQAVLESNITGTGSKARESKIYCADELKASIGHGHLVCHYQPKIAIASGAVVGVEALVRWQHPQDGLVFPDQFIPLAEQNNLIDELTRAVLRQTLQQTRIWREQGRNLQVAVNVCVDNLRSLDFPECVTQYARDAGVPESSLTLEVTESRLMTDLLKPLDILTRLRLRRITLSIDDFGMGHSSLAQLRDLPFQELKIDRSFVHAAWRNSTLRAIFEASLGMARRLSMKTVAEGVEDKADWDFLRASGCDVAQGYFVARPMPPEAIGAWMDEWEVRRDTLVASV